MADVRIQIRHDESGAWEVANTTLENGEIGCETDTGQCKVGDGSSTWDQLAYIGYATDVDTNVDGGTY